MTFGSAAFGEDPFGVPATRAGQPAVQGAVAVSGFGTLIAEGLQVDAPFATFTGIGTLIAAGLIARQGALTVKGAGALRADGSDLASRLLTRNGALRVWTVELDVYRAR